MTKLNKQLSLTEFCEQAKTLILCGDVQGLQHLHDLAHQDEPAFLIAMACWQNNHKRAARTWFEKVCPSPSISLTMLCQILNAAIQLGQASQALSIGQQLARTHASSVEEATRIHKAALALMTLALRMRLPHGRNGAWAAHLKILDYADTLLKTALPGLPEDMKVEATHNSTRFAHLSHGSQQTQDQP